MDEQNTKIEETAPAAETKPERKQEPKAKAEPKPELSAKERLHAIAGDAVADAAEQKKKLAEVSAARVEGWKSRALELKHYQAALTNLIRAMTDFVKGTPFEAHMSFPTTEVEIPGGTFKHTTFKVVHSGITFQIVPVATDTASDPAKAKLGIEINRSVGDNEPGTKFAKFVDDHFEANGKVLSMADFHNALIAAFK